MKPRYCYWSVVDGDYAAMAQAVVHSARRVGVTRDFHIWTDRPIRGAICHRAGEFEKWGCMFKLIFLRDRVQKLPYDYYVWLDMDAYFVHDPGDVLRVMRGSPMHVSLESDLCSSQNRRQEWWECPNRRFAELMWAKGVQSQAIFNVNGGFIVVHRDVIGTLSSLTYDFWKWCQTQGYLFNDEPLLAYAMHRLCGDLHLHTLRETADVWASDWTGRFRDKLPDGRPWWSTDYFTGKRTRINPAIVHAMRSKDALVQAGLSLPHRNRVSRNR